MGLSCAVSEILPLISQNLKRSRDPEHFFRGQSIPRALVLLCINQHTKFELPSFTDSNDMIGAKIRKRKLALDTFYLNTKFGDSRFSRSGNMIAGIKIENGSREPSHAPFRVDYHSKART